MKRLLLTVTVLIGLAASVSASAPTRKVIYTMLKNETIYYGQFVQWNGRYVAVVSNTDYEKYSVVINGAKIASWTGGAPSFYYLNLDQTNGYIFSYNNGDGETYLNINGKTEGPFDEIIWAHDNGDFAYTLAGRGYVKIGGKVKGPFVGSAPTTFTPSGKFIYGYYDEDDDAVVNVNGNLNGYYDYYYRPQINDKGNYIYGYRDNDEGRWSIIVNGKQWGSYDDVNEPCLNENGDYAFQYENDGNQYIVINGKTSQSYESVGMVRLTENGKVGYVYTKNDKYHLWFDGKMVKGAYENIGGLTINSAGNYGFNFSRDDEAYVNINGTEYGPYGYTWDIVLSDNGTYMFDGREADDVYFINVNGTVLHPAQVAFNFTIDNNGKYSYTYTDGTAKYKCDNGKNIHVGDEIGGEDYEEHDESTFDFNSTDGAHSFFSNGDYNYVVIDGARYGKSSAISAQWSDVHKAFIWTAVEGNQVVSYEMKF